MLSPTLRSRSDLSSQIFCFSFDHHFLSLSLQIIIIYTWNQTILFCFLLLLRLCLSFNLFKIWLINNRTLAFLLFVGTLLDLHWNYVTGLGIWTCLLCSLQLLQHHFSGIVIPLSSLSSSFFSYVSIAEFGIKPCEWRVVTCLWGRIYKVEYNSAEKVENIYSQEWFSFLQRFFLSHRVSYGFLNFSWKIFPPCWYFMRNLQMVFLLPKHG